MTTSGYSTQTTIVTGASSGIGEAFARELARRGSDVILVARRLDRLTALAADLEAAHGIRATAIPLDLSVPGAGRALAAEVQDRGMSVTGLVNNAGFGTDGPFHEEHPDRLAEEITVDVANLVDLTRAFIGPLRESGRGILVNVASLAAYMPNPNMAVYAACKAFVLSFTEALWYESRGTGLRVLSLSPGLTRTGFFDDLGNGYSGAFQVPEQVVRTAMRELDRGARRPSVVSGRRNSLLVTLPRLLSRRRIAMVAGSVGDRGASGRSATPAGTAATPSA